MQDYNSIMRSVTECMASDCTFLNLFLLCSIYDRSIILIYFIGCFLTETENLLFLYVFNSAICSPFEARNGKHASPLGSLQDKPTEQH